MHGYNIYVGRLANNKRMKHEIIAVINMMKNDYDAYGVPECHIWDNVNGISKYKDFQEQLDSLVKSGELVKTSGDKTFTRYALGK